MANKNSNLQRIILVSFWTIYLIFPVSSSIASLDVLPHPCDNVKCPPLNEMTCPEDSMVREDLDIHADDLVAPLHTSTEVPHNVTQMGDELYAQCCLSKKCICRTCYIPNCHNTDEVVIELIPETMDAPGHCCGQYECHKEPNCTELHTTDSVWLNNCQRCKCYAGERICHQSCDEGIKSPTAICSSKNLNTFFEHGDSWKDGCYECECVNGEEKCVMPFCRNVNCPTYRQVLLKDNCCPICWPKGVPMPNGEEDYEEDADTEAEGVSGNRIYHESAESTAHSTAGYADEVDTLPNIIFDNEDTDNNNNVTKVDTAVAAVASTESVNKAEEPCAHQNEHSTIQIYPEIVEVVRQTHQNDYLYVIIGCLSLLVLILVAWNIHLRAKQRSYRPVSNFDDNFNKTSSNIKKMNDYV